MADLPLIPGTLAVDCYPASAQALYNEMFSKGHAVGDSIVGILIQDAAPDPVYRGVMGWIPTSGDIPIYPGYVFVWHATVGHWVSRNPVAAGDPSRRIYVGTSASITTYDGGDGNALTIGSGPMWEIDTDFAGSVPVGVGLIPGSVPPATISAELLRQDDLGQVGEYKHTLVTAEIPSHNHIVPITKDSQISGDTDESTIANQGVAGTNIDWPSNNTGGDEAHCNMQPYLSVYFLKRTIRIFYIAG